MSKRNNKKEKAAARDAKLDATVSKLSGNSSQKSPSYVANEPLLFHKGNYIMILAGFGLILLGYLLMSGGAQTDPNTWDADSIYSTRRTLIAPILILAGLGMEIYAVFKK